jgi:Tfp pilus assembly protein PilE
MGQQQLLLLVLSVIIVGIAVVVGINMFATSAESANIEAVTNDLLHLSSMAQQYFIKPTSMGGGGESFTGLTDINQLTTKPINDNGTYSISTAGSDSTVVLLGDPVRSDKSVQVTVYSNRVRTEIL